MKRKKVIFILLIIIIIGLIYFCSKHIYFFNDNYTEVNDFELKMVEKYLNNKYNLNLKIKNYEYEYFDIGSNGGSHYYFYFEPIENIKLRAVLNYCPLKSENLKRIMLNVTNIDLAKEFEEYIEKNTGLSCEITELRLIEGDNKEDYYYFRVLLNKNENYWISGIIKQEENFEETGNMQLSDNILYILELKKSTEDNLNLKDILEKINKYSDLF